MGFYLRWLLAEDTGSRRVGLVAPYGIGVVPDQGPNPRHLHGQAGSYSLCATGKVLDPVLILGEDYTVLSSFYMQRLLLYINIGKRKVFFWLFDR